MLPYLELILLFTSLISKKTAGFSNCRASFSNMDHVLISHVIRTLENKSFESCTFSCELEPQCFSVNYFASTKTCELNNVSKEYFPGDFTRRKGAFYMEMVIRKYHPCWSMDCENGGTCVSSRVVMCKCLKGFSGLRCESMYIFYLAPFLGVFWGEEIAEGVGKKAYLHHCKTATMNQKQTRKKERKLTD